MKALVEKEIRMLLPAFGAALVLAVIPGLTPTQSNWGTFSGWLFMFGIMMLGVSAFGREIGLKTFPFILAQPLDRSRIWWTKISVLGVCTLLVSSAWFVSTVHSGLGSVVRDADIDSLEPLAWMALIIVVLITGGIWMTLLVRQMAAAFWLAYLVPAVIGVGIKAMGGANWIVCIALCLYSAAAFFLARRQFLHMQDTGWIGGALTLGGSRTVEANSSTREHQPWRTLFRKELKLHAFTLAGLAALFVVHLGVIAIRKAGAHAFSETTFFALQSFGLVWVVMPFVAGSQSVAEERQNGTLDGLLCLSVSRRAQFCIKLAFVVVLGGLFSAVLLCGAEEIGNALGAGTGGVVGNAFEFVHILTAFVLLSLVGFYASTLTRSVAQALAAGVGLVAAYFIITDLANQSGTVDAFGPRLWTIIANPALVIAIVWLSYGNFKWTFESGRRWRWNIIALAIVVVLAYVSAATVYHRAWGLWEWVGSRESAHGPAVLPLGKPVALRSSGGSGFAVILPDGRLWKDRLVDGWKQSGSGGKFSQGSNWVDAVLLDEETVAIRSDGTLWVSEKRGWMENLVQFGAEANWKAAARRSGYSVNLLKRDGTLWSWGPLEYSPTRYVGHGHGESWGLGTNIYKGEYPGLRSYFKPVRFRAESNWDRIIGGWYNVCAWKRDGDAWAFHQPQGGDNWSEARLPQLDGLQFKSDGSSPVWVRNDGTLWLHRAWVLNLGKTHPETRSLPELVQISKDSDWVAAIWRGQLLALKADGSLWKWNTERAQPLDEVLLQPPHKVGTHSDWVGVGGWGNDPVVLAADGSLWLWPGKDQSPMNSDEWLAPADRLTKIDNIFAGNELR